jgi:hypothetical protein
VDAAKTIHERDSRSIRFIRKYVTFTDKVLDREVALCMTLSIAALSQIWNRFFNMTYLACGLMHSVRVSSFVVDDWEEKNEPSSLNPWLECNRYLFALAIHRFYVRVLATPFGKTTGFLFQTQISQEWPTNDTLELSNMYRYVSMYLDRVDHHMVEAMDIEDLLSVDDTFRIENVYEVMVASTLRCHVRNFYDHASAEKITTLSAKEYMDWAGERIAFEQQRCTDLISLTQKERLEIVAVVRSSLFASSIVKELVDRGMRERLEKNIFLDVAVAVDIHYIFSRLPSSAIVVVQEMFYAMALNAFLLCNDNILSILITHRYLTNVIADGFDSRPDIRDGGYRNAVQTFSKSSTCDISERLAQFCNGVLLSSDDDDDDDVMDGQVLKEIADFMVFVPSKDVFILAHQKLLSQRLLCPTTNIAKEKKLLGCLKEKLGCGATSRMEKMVLDWEMADEMNRLFRAERNDDDGSSDFSCIVLRTGCWPTIQFSEFTVPQNIYAQMQMFATFYQKNYANTVLQFMPSVGFVTMRVFFKCGEECEVVMTPEQAVVCLLFNNANVLSIDAIVKHTSMTRRTVEEILSTTELVVSLRDDNCYSFNSFFQPPCQKFQLPTRPQCSMSCDVAVDAPVVSTEMVMEDRKFMVDSILIRMMKAKRQMSFDVLVLETIDQCLSRFCPDVAFVKACVESLIEREYLARSEEDKNVLLYVT